MAMFLIFLFFAVVGGVLIYSSARQRRHQKMAPGVRALSPAETPSDTRQFRTLLAYGNFVSAFGWVAVALGAGLLLEGLSSGNPGGVGGLFLIGAAALIISGVGMVVFGQVISCFASIEKNTRTTNELLKQTIKTSREKPPSNPPSSAGYQSQGLPVANEALDEQTPGFLSPRETSERPVQETLDFCYHCGSDLPQNVTVCPDCGKQRQ